MGYGYGYGFGIAQRRARGSAPWSPASAFGSDLKLFWDPNDASGASIPASQGASGGALTLVGSPTVEAGTGPQLPTDSTSPNLLVMPNSSSVYGTFSQQTFAGDCTFVACYAHTSTTSTQTVFGRAGSAQSSLSFTNGGATLTARTQGGPSTNLPIPVSCAAARFQVAEWSYVQVTGMATPYINGVAGTPTFVGTQGFVFDQVGLTNAGSQANGRFGKIMAINRVMTSGERTALLSYLEVFQGKYTYAATAGSDSSATPFNKSTPYLTPAKVTTCRNGDTFATKAGDILRLTATAVQPGGVFIDSGLWGDLTKHGRWYGSTCPTDWVSLGGGVYSRAEANHPYQGTAGGTGYIFDTAAAEPAALSSFSPSILNYGTWMLAMRSAYWLAPQGHRLSEDTGSPTTPAAGKFGYSAGTLYVRLADSGNPNGRVEVPIQTVAATGLQMGYMITMGQNNAVVRRTDLRYASASGIQQTASGSTYLDRVDCRYMLSDGLDGAGSGVHYLQDCASLYTGNAANDGSDGDTSSFHGGSTINRLRFFSAGGDKAGIDDVNTVTAVNDNCMLIGGNRPIAVAGQGGTSVEQLFRNCFVEAATGVTYPYAAHNRGGTIRLLGCTVLGISTASTVGVYQETAVSVAPLTTIKNCIFENLDTGWNLQSGTVTEDYNCNHATTYKSVTSGSATTGAHSITSDPLLIDRANGNFQPGSSSPCKATGVNDTDLTTYFDGIARANPPDMGALKAA